ncbi:hypothetical protein MSPP1_000924 [Malassezia sp. CBS 17886]|nr:hypothetical protein MSPP1_000924 [Malassezia sp. CBS 17886]
MLFTGVSMLARVGAVRVGSVASASMWTAHSRAGPALFSTSALVADPSAAPRGAAPRKAAPPGGASKGAARRKPAAPKPRAAPKPAKPAKQQPWELRGEDGKPVPLPLDTKPKRMSSFLIYFSDRLPELKKHRDHQRISAKTNERVTDVPSITSAVSREWKALSGDERARIEARADAERTKYEHALEKWKKSLTPADVRRQNQYLNAQRKKGKSVPANLKDPGAPKRPGGAFFLYFQDLRKKDAVHGPATEVAKEAGKKWQALPAAEKHSYEKAAHDAYVDYQKQLAKYKEAHGEA